MGLHRLLGTLLSNELSTDERLDIIETEYDIPMEEDLREDVSVVCNLSEGIREDATIKATMNTTKKIIMNIHTNGSFTLEQIALATEKDIDEVKSIIEEAETMK